MPEIIWHVGCQLEHSPLDGLIHLDLVSSTSTRRRLGLSRYVEQYKQLEQRAVDADDHAEQYKARAEKDRWEQCRIVHDAIESGDYSRGSFADAVGRSKAHIARQYTVWSRHGSRARRPAFHEAMAEAMGSTAEAETDRKQLSHARQVMADPSLARQVLADPSIQRKLMSNDRIRSDLNRTAREVDAHRAARVARQQREDAPRLTEAKEYYDALARLLHAKADVNKALDLLRGLPPLSEDQRKDLRETLGWLSTSVDWVYEAIKARRSATLSDEIESYLAEQEA
jgi:Family of unknown function (DUF6192)